MEFTAPAKVNLYLNILYKRDDGYHEIETLFERISLVDTLHVELSKTKTVITCNDCRIPTDKDSIMGRAVTLFNEVTVRPFNFKIKLDKKIPVSAGMGGGSSDAATLLMAMNDLTGKKLSTGTLCDIGRKLGADVPFFIMNASFAIGRGRGDILETIESHIKMWHVVVTPPVGVSTKEVYAKVTPQCLTKKGDTDRMFTSFLKEGKIRGIAENLRNDLQDITLREFPIIGEVFSEISNLGAGGVLLSGSGPTVFGVFDEEGAKKAAKELAAKFSSKKGWAVFVAHTL